MINLRTILNKFRILLYNPIIVYLILIIGIGIVAIQSAIPLAKINYPNLPANYATKQLMFVSLGAFVAILVVIIGVDRIRALRWWIYGFWMIPLLGLFIYKKFHIRTSPGRRSFSRCKFFPTCLPSRSISLSRKNFILSDKVIITHDRHKSYNKMKF